MANIKISISLVCLFITLPLISCEQDQSIAMLNQMRVWGRNFRNMLKSMNVEKNAMQYLVAAVVRNTVHDDAKQVHLLNQCPEALPNSLLTDKHILCGTSAVLLNKIDPSVWKRSPWKNEKKYENHSWHGEYMLLRDGILDRLIDDFLELNGNVTCEVFLYSHFIPCNYSSDKQPYNCSRLISDYIRSYTGSCKITTVGFSSVFMATVKNKDKIIAELKQCNVNVIKVVDPSTYTESAKNTRKALQRISDTKTHTVQEIMTMCLLYSPLSACLDETNPKKLVVQFTNYLMYNTSQSFQSSYKGSLSGGLKWRNTCEDKITKVLEQLLGSDNKKCPDKKYNVILASTCARKGLDFAKYFGTLEGKITDDNWTPCTQAWKHMYSFVDKKAWNAVTNCDGTLLTKRSLCTLEHDTLPRDEF